MNSWLLRACLCWAFFASPACADSDQLWGSDLSPWVGKYPTDTIDGKKVDILREPKIRRALQQLVSAADMKLLETYDVSIPIARVDSYLVINMCRPHYCPSELAMLVVDTSSPKLWVGLFLREANRVSTRWYGNRDDYGHLPEAILRQFQARHGN